MNRSRNSDRHATKSGHGFVWFTLMSTGDVVERAECDLRMPAKIAVGGGHHRGRGHDDEYLNGKKDRTVPKREELVRYFCLCAERVRPVVDTLELCFSFSGPKNQCVGVVIFS